MTGHVLAMVLAPLFVLGVAAACCAAAGIFDRDVPGDAQGGQT